MNISFTYKFLNKTKLFLVTMFVFLMLGMGNVSGATYYSRATGNWNGAVWATTTGGTAAIATITSADAVVIQTGNVITVNVAAVCSSVTVNAPANMSLTNGADACNVFWALTTRMHIGGGAAHVIGTIITDAGGADITFGNGASLQGRALAHTAITLINNAITEPTCAAVVSS